MSFTVDQYIKETRSIKNSLNSNDEKTFKKLYYGTFPLMEHKELPKLNICSTYDMDTKVINIDGIWHLIFDCNLYDYIQLFIYSYFSDECLSNFEALYYAVKRDYQIAHGCKRAAHSFNRRLKKQPFIMPDYSSEYRDILYNIKYVSFPLLCLHEIVHYSFINESKKDFFASSINSAIKKTKKQLEQQKDVVALLSDSVIVQEIFCDCESLYGVLHLFSSFKDKISPKDIVDSAVLNIMGILMVFEAKDPKESNVVIGNHIRLHVLLNYIQVLIEQGYLDEDVYLEANDIVKYYFTDIFPCLRKLKLKYR